MLWQRGAKGLFDIEGRRAVLCFCQSESKEGAAVGKRIISWLTYNVALGLLPVVMPVGFLWLANRLTVESLVATPGVFFFALMVSATSLRDIHEMLGPLSGDLSLMVFYSIFLFGVIVSSAFYGCFLWDTVVGLRVVVLRMRLFLAAVTLAGVLLLLGAAVQLFLGRVTAR